MRILYVTTISMTMLFFKNFIRELLDEGHTVDIATNEADFKVDDCYREWGCKVHSISTSRSPLSTGNERAIKQLRNIAKDYDIIHCHTPMASAVTRLACKPLRKKGVKVIYSAHGFHFYKGAPKMNWMIYYPIEKTCAHWTDILVTTNFEDFEFAKKKIKAKRVVHVPGVGVETKKFADTVIDRDKKREEIGIPKNSLFLLSVGELNENKNQEVILRALAQVKNKNIHYAIAGTGPLKEHLEKTANELGISEQFHLLGFRRDIAELDHAADVFVFPSIREGLGMSALEAMSCNLPLICSDNRGTQCYAVNGENAFVCHSVDEYAKAIIALTDDEKRLEMSKKAKDKVNEFDVSNVNAMLKDLYFN